MDYEEKQLFYTEIKSALDKRNEITVEELLKKTELDETRLKEFLKNNLVYFLSEDTIKKIKTIELRILKIVSDKELEMKIADLRKLVEEEIGELAYLRFLAKEGQVVCQVKKADENNNFEGKKLNFDGTEFTIHTMNTEEKKQFSMNHGNHLEGILRTRFGRRVNYDIDGLLSHKKGIYIGSKKFRSLAEVKGIFAKMLKGSKQGEKISEENAQYLKSLMKYHNSGEEKLKDFDHFTVDFHPKFDDTKCFFVVRKDGSKEDFSYVKCLKEISKMIK